MNRLIKIIKNKNFKKIILGAVLLALVINFVGAATIVRAANPVSAGLQTGAQNAISDAKQAAIYLGVFYAVLYILLQVLVWFYTTAILLLNTAFAYATQPDWFNNIIVVKAWEVFRNFADVWFILVLLVIAIATILRVESYQARRTLVWLIIIATLINFSLPMTRVVVDFTNVITFQFIKSIGKPFTNIKTGRTDYDVGSTFQQAMPMQQALQAAENNFSTEGLKTAAPSLQDNTPSTQNTSPPAQSNGLPELVVPTVHAADSASTASNVAGAVAGTGCAAAAVGFAPVTFGLSAAVGGVACSIIGMATQLTFEYAIVKISAWLGFGGILLTPYINLIISNILFGFAIYVILAISLFLLARTIVLMFLLIVSPVGFLFTIIPETQGYASKWWNMLLKQAFFAPAIAFLLWVSLSLLTLWQGIINANNPQDTSLTNPANGRIIVFIIAVVMLYLCLKIARDMGAYGADTAMKWGKKIKDEIQGFVVGSAARRFIAPIGDRLAQEGFGQNVSHLSPFFGTYANRGVDWLRKRGDADQLAQEQATLGMKMPEAQRAGYFARLNLAGKEALLRQMQPKERERFINNLSPNQQKLARGITGSALFTAGERKAMDMAQFKALTTQQQRERFGDLNDDAKSEYLKGLNADEKAKFVNQLTGNAKTSAQALLASARFSQKEQQDYRIADIMLGKEEDQRTAFLALSNDDDREAMLRKMTSDEQRVKFVAGLKKPPANFAQLSPEEKANWTTAADRAQNLIETRFTAPEKKSYYDAEAKQIIKDAGANLANDIMLIPDKDRRERVFRTASDFQKAELAFKLREKKDPNGKEIGKEMLSSLTSKLSPEELDKYHRENANYIGRQKVDAIESAVEDMPEEELAYLVGSKDVNKLSEILNTTHNAAVITRIGNTMRAQGATQKFMGSVNKQRYVKDVLGINRLSPTGQINPNYKEEMRKQLSNTDPKTLRNISPPEMIRQSDFMEDLLMSGSFQNLRSISGDPIRAEATGEMINKVIEKYAGSREELDKLIESVGGMPGAEAVAEGTLVPKDSRLKGAVLAEIVEKKLGNPLLAEQIREQLASGPGKEIIKKILEGKPIPNKK